MKFLRCGFWVSALILLVSCTANGEKFAGLEKPDASYAQVYVYRPFSISQPTNYPDVLLDSRLVGKLKNSGFLSVKVFPGFHTLTLSGKYMQWNYPEYSMPIRLEGGKTYFYRLLPFTGPGRTSGGVYFANYSYTFKTIDDPDAALAELKKLNESVDK